MARQTDGESAETAVMGFMILTSTEDAVDDVLSFLEDIETWGPVYWARVVLI